LAVVAKARIVEEQSAKQQEAAFDALFKELRRDTHEKSEAIEEEDEA